MLHLKRFYERLPPSFQPSLPGNVLHRLAFDLGSRSKPTENFVPRHASLGGRLWVPLDDPQWCFTECGGGGDCQFHSVAFAMRSDMFAMRSLAAAAVDEENIDRLIDYYNDSYKVVNVAPIKQIPDKSERIRAFRKLLESPGPGYEGDSTTLSLLCKSGNIGFMVITETNALHPELWIHTHIQHVVILRHVDSHWQAIGWVNPNDPLHRVQTTFDIKQLPDYLRTKIQTYVMDEIIISDTISIP